MPMPSAQRQTATKTHTAQGTKATMNDSNNESTKSPTEPPRKRRSPTYKTPPSSTCNGISIKYIHNSQRLNTLRKSHLILGFKHTIREGWTTRSRLEHPSHTSFVWPFHLPVVSALTDGNDVTKLVWVLEGSRLRIPMRKYKRQST